MSAVYILPTFWQQKNVPEELFFGHAPRRRINSRFSAASRARSYPKNSVIRNRCSFPQPSTLILRFFLRKADRLSVSE
jgi:hypothetical protein